MAKKTEMTESEIRRGLAARQPRQNGRFASLPPEQKVGNVRASRAKASSAVASTPAVTDVQSEKEIANQIGLLESLIKQRNEMGFESSELENYVVGMKGQKGVRSVVEDYIRSNRDKFNQEDPAGAAAYQLMEEAVTISESALTASHDQAKRIYAQVKFIRELAANTQGDQGDIATKLEEIISPIEKQLKKKSSFKAFLAEKASDFRKTIPEKIASKIPVVGGLLGEFLKKKREDREDIERYTGSLQKQIARKGRSGESLNVSGKRGFAEIGGTSAADIPGMLAGTASTQSSTASPQTGTSSTLGELLKEVSQIRKLLQNKFASESDTSDTDELQKRESELEGLGAEKPIKGEAKKGGGMLSSLLEKLRGMGGGGGIMSSIASGAESIGSALLGAPSLAMKGLRGAGGLAVKGLRGAGGLAVKGLRGAGGLISKFGGAKSLELFKTTSLYKDTASIGKSVSGVTKGALNLGKSAVSGVSEAASGVTKGALNLGKSAVSGVSEAASGVAKGAMNLGKSAIGKVGQAASGVAKGAMNLGKSVLGGAMNLGKSVLGGAGQAASGVAKGALNLGKSAVGRVANLSKSAISSIANTDVAKGAMNLGKSTIGKVGQAASGVAKGAMNLGKSAVGGAMNLGKSAVGGAMNLGKSALGGAGQAASGVASTGGGFFSNLAAKAGSALSSMNPVKGLSSFIGKNAGKVAKSIVSFPGLGAVISTVMGAVDIASIKSDPELSVDEKKEKIGRSIVGTLGQALGTIGGGALGTLIPVPGIGTLVGTLGGGWVGGKLAEMLADQIGGKGIYDMVASIPGVGSLIEVGGTEDQKTGKEAENAITAAATSATGTAAEGGASSSTTVEGKVTNPATANTTVGRMVAQATAEQNGLNEARNMPTATGGNTNNTANVQNKISNTTNNFNDDIRIRNNEPTIKQMQAYSIMP
jgi:hypothetical protein